MNNAGYQQESAQLVEQTIAAFRDNYAEFLQPFTGSGEGVKDYAWTAGLFIREIIEEIFGLAWTPDRGLTASPTLPVSLQKAHLSLDGLHLPDGTTAMVIIDNNTVTIDCQRE